MVRFVVERLSAPSPTGQTPTPRHCSAPRTPAHGSAGSSAAPSRCRPAPCASAWPDTESCRWGAPIGDSVPGCAAPQSRSVLAARQRHRSDRERVGDPWLIPALPVAGPLCHNEREKHMQPPVILCQRRGIRGQLLRGRPGSRQIRHGRQALGDQIWTRLARAAVKRIGLGAQRIPLNPTGQPREETKLCRCAQILKMNQGYGSRLSTFNDHRSLSSWYVARSIVVNGPMSSHGLFI